MSTPIDRDKLLSVGYLARGRTRDRVVEGRRDDGVRVKATTDELGNTTTEHASRDDRVDVHIAAPHLRVRGTLTEERG
jgi:hypothetical protein